jgi:hypothetical protein
MRRPEHHRGWSAFVGFAVLVGAVLMDAGAGAMVLPMQDVRAAPASTMATPDMPTISHGMPCALCYVAPAPGSHGFTGDGNEPEALAWWVHAQSTPKKVRLLAVANRRDRVPIRIALCRWLD